MPPHSLDFHGRGRPNGHTQAAEEPRDPSLDHGVLASIVPYLPSIGVAVCVCDEADQIRYANTLFRTTFLNGLGDQRSEFTRVMVEAIREGRGIKLVSTDLESFARAIRERRRNMVGSLSFTTDTTDGRWWWVTDSKLSNGWLVAVAQDVSLLKQQEFQLRDDHASAMEEARTDFLTGLPNRRYGFRQAEALFARVRHRAGTFTIAVLDIDHFKSINDIYGHEIGDRALVHFGSVLTRRAGCRDQFSRIGGEEFLLVSAEPDPGYVTRLLQQLRVSIPPLVLGGGREALRFTFSAGIASASVDETWRGLLHRADMALYHAKANGRDRLEHADPAL